MTHRRKRLFLRHRRNGHSYRRRIGFLLGIGAVAALASCSPETSYWSPAESSKQPRVDWVRFDHTVAFDARARGLNDAERERLDEFFERIEPRYGDQILVGTGATATAKDEVAIQRVAAVAEYLRSNGIKVGLLPSVAQARWDGSVRLMVGRYVVTPPRCPDWTKSASYDPLNVVSSNFGCATATNLDLMVADPGDLVRGRPAGPADGAAAARAIKTYREGNVPTPSATIQSIGGGGSSK